MKYTWINWIKTEMWEGALIEDAEGKRYLTSGVHKWLPTPERPYTVIDNEPEGFIRRWDRNFPHALSGLPQ